MRKMGSQRRIIKIPGLRVQKKIRLLKPIKTKPSEVLSTQRTRMVDAEKTMNRINQILGLVERQLAHTHSNKKVSREHVTIVEALLSHLSPTLRSIERTRIDLIQNGNLKTTVQDKKSFSELNKKRHDLIKQMRALGFPKRDIERLTNLVHGRNAKRIRTT
ncbi:MAG: hypothetical protein PHY80_06435 [Rickettsiales bacterium]|nr:hypothetical protein [Rickettsiales bacterium]